MQIGYIRVSKSDGSQVLDLQRDTMIAAGVDPERIYFDGKSLSVHERTNRDDTLIAQLL